jgi:drug/metabolite transporter (DMT)-like permease
MNAINISSVFSGQPGSKPAMWLIHVAALVCVAFWGMAFVSTKILLESGLGTVEIYIYRFIIAYLLVLLISHKRFKSHSLRDEGLFALCGITSGSLYFIAENTALQYTLVGNVSLLTSMSPLITAMLAGLMYKNERPSRGMLVGSAIAFVGVACVIFNSSTNLQVHPIGDILSLAAAFSWAVYSIILRRLNANYDVWFVTRKTFFYGVITALPFLLFAPSLQSPIDVVSNGTVMFHLIFLAAGASLLGFSLWSVSVRWLGAVMANNYMYIQPIVTMIGSFIIIGEAISPMGAFGCALILAGLWLGDWLNRRALRR